MTDTTRLKEAAQPRSSGPCAFCGAPGYALLAGYGFKIKCTNTECTVETPIRTHRHEVETIWNRRSALAAPPGSDALQGAALEGSQDARDAERYRWLRERAEMFHGGPMERPHVECSVDLDWPLTGKPVEAELDAAIDSALAPAKG